MSRSVVVAAVRLLWFLLPLTVLAPISEALSDEAGVGRWVPLAGLWLLWAVALAASAIPMPSTLTVIRVLAAATVPLAIWLIIDQGAAVATTVALIHTVLVAGLSHLAVVGDVFADGASYGDERRMLLRPHAAALWFGVPIAWLAVVAGLAVGPLLIANERWVLGVVASIVGLGLIAVGGRALYELARRWIVFVPNGFVLHDLVALTEPVLFRRTAVEQLGPALDGTPARDLSGRAAGLLLECQLTDPAPLGLRSENGNAALTDVRRFLFAPTRPGELLDEAERRRLPIG